MNSTHLLRSYRCRFGVVLRAFWARFGVILALLRNKIGNRNNIWIIWDALWSHFRGHFRTLFGRFPWKWELGGQIFEIFGTCDFLFFCELLEHLGSIFDGYGEHLGIVFSCFSEEAETMKMWAPPRRERTLEDRGRLENTFFLIYLIFSDFFRTLILYQIW